MKDKRIYITNNQSVINDLIYAIDYRKENEKYLAEVFNISIEEVLNSRFYYYDGEEDYKEFYCELSY